MSIIKSAFDGEKDIATGQASWKITTIKMIFYNLVYWGITLYVASEVFAIITSTFQNSDSGQIPESLRAAIIALSAL